jgi:hypothetical protein
MKEINFSIFQNIQIFISKIFKTLKKKIKLKEKEFE